MQTLPCKSNAASRNNQLVRRKEDPGFAIFWPMTGDGTFGNDCWVMCSRDPYSKMLRVEKETEELTAGEYEALQQLRQSHMFWWSLVSGGALMIVRPRLHGDTSNPHKPRGLSVPKHSGGALV